MPFVDFAEIRERLSIEDAAEMLPVKWKREAQQLRADCPVHGGERSLIVTPSKGLFVCKATADARKGGDCNRAQAKVITDRLEWLDNEKQLQAQQNTDPYQNPNGGYRSGAIDLG